MSKLPLAEEECNTRTNVNLRLEDYVRSRYRSTEGLRLAILPFDVPETFARSGSDTQHYGQELARQFRAQLSRTAAVQIVEVFNQPPWPGKREEFFHGNYQALALARRAGYDFVLIGYLDELNTDADLKLHTKLIDTSNNVNVWDATTVLHSAARETNKTLDRFWLTPERPEQFHFPERTEALTRCVVEQILAAAPMP